MRSEETVEWTEVGAGLRTLLWRSGGWYLPACCWQAAGRFHRKAEGRRRSHTYCTADSAVRLGDAGLHRAAEMGPSWGLRDPWSERSRQPPSTRPMACSDTTPRGELRLPFLTFLLPPTTPFHSLGAQAPHLPEVFQSRSKMFVLRASPHRAKVKILFTRPIHVLKVWVSSATSLHVKSCIDVRPPQVLPPQVVEWQRAGQSHMPWKDWDFMLLLTYFWGGHEAEPSRSESAAQVSWIFDDAEGCPEPRAGFKILFQHLSKSGQLVSYLSY